MKDKEKEKLNSLINLAKEKGQISNNAHQYLMLADCLQECELHIDYYGPSNYCLNRDEVLYTFKSDNEEVCNELRSHYIYKCLIELCEKLIEDEYVLARDENAEILVEIKKVTSVSKLPSAPTISFEEIESILIEHLSSANNVIFAAVAWFNNKKIFDILDKKVSSGVIVYVMIDDNKQNELDNIPKNERIISRLESHYSKLRI